MFKSLMRLLQTWQTVFVSMKCMPKALVSIFLILCGLTFTRCAFMEAFMLFTTAIIVSCQSDFLTQCIIGLKMGLPVYARCLTAVETQVG